MCQKSGRILLALVFIGLGVLNCAYPSDILLKSVKFYSRFLVVIGNLHLNVIVGVLSMLAAVALLLGKSHAPCLVQTVVIANIALQGIPYVPTLDVSEQFGAVISLMKYVGILGASLLITK
jgi:hypothetical protein